MRRWISRRPNTGNCPPCRVPGLQKIKRILKLEYKGAPAAPASQKDSDMTIHNAVTAFAGFMVLLSVALTYWVSPYWVWLTVFVGANLLQSSLTGFCPAAMIFAKMGLKPS
jgi:hypothetical protein